MNQSMRYMICCLAIVAVTTLGVRAADEKSASTPQTICPVTGEAINKALFVDVEGCRVYVCCQGCVAKIKADPKTYIKKIRDKGEEPAKAPAPEGGEAAAPEKTSK